MHEVLLKLIKRHPNNGHDWMGFKPMKKGDFTFHHIIKESDGGAFVIENGAVLVCKAHQLLHVIENTDYNLYIELNQIFREINDSQTTPSLECKIRINEMILAYLTLQIERMSNEKKSRKFKQIARQIRMNLIEQYEKLYENFYIDKQYSLREFNQNPLVKSYKKSLK